ncbi:hypothetical protein DL770_000419 [Monosporascus sp. CRB-9-2]|nr:hypothetical protein DL770_000419 [Monosporascus sp. CRB-9-2]
MPSQDPDQSTENDEYPEKTAEDDVPQNETESVKTEGLLDQDQDHQDQDHNHSETDPDRQLIDEMADDNQDVQEELQKLRDEVVRFQARQSHHSPTPSDDADRPRRENIINSAFGSTSTFRPTSMAA